MPLLRFLSSDGGMSTEMNPVDIRLPVESPPEWVGKPVGGPGATETTILCVVEGPDGAAYLGVSSECLEWSRIVLKRASSSDAHLALSQTQASSTSS